MFGADMEEWRDVPGYEGLYQVSSLGRVRAPEKRDLRGHIRKEKPISQSTNWQGRPRVSLRRDGTKRVHFVHRLVALAFVPNPDEKGEVNHINGDKADNRAENLEWCTRSENMLHAEKTGLHSMAPALEAHKVKVCQIAGRVVIKAFNSIEDAARETGVNAQNISSAASGRRGTAGGYEWRYYDVR